VLLVGADRTKVVEVTPSVMASGGAIWFRLRAGVPAVA